MQLVNFTCRVAGDPSPRVSHVTSPGHVTCSTCSGIVSNKTVEHISHARTCFPSTLAGVPASAVSQSKRAAKNEDLIKSPIGAVSEYTTL